MVNLSLKPTTSKIYKKKQTTKKQKTKQNKTIYKTKKKKHQNLLASFSLRFGSLFQVPSSSEIHLRALRSVTVGSRSEVGEVIETFGSKR